MTANDRFIYTQWDLTVEEAVKNDLAQSLYSGKTISVLRSGGQVEIQGRKVTGITENFQEFETRSRYLMFLDSVPATGAFRARAERPFKLTGGQVKRLTPDPRYPELETELADVIVRDTEAAVNTVNGVKG